MSTESPERTSARPEGAAPAAPDAAPVASKRTILFIFIGLMVTMLLSSLDQTVFSTALPTIVGELNGVDHMLWVTTGYILASTIVMPIYGKLGDTIGRKGLFLAAVGIFIAGSIVGGMADSMAWLIAGRAIQGLGGGGLIILSQAIIADVVPARERGKYMGVMGGVFALSAVLGPILGGWFTEGIGWRWAFWINVPLGLLAMAMAAVFIRLPKRDTHRPTLDVLGIVFMAIAAASIVLVTSWGGTEYDWNSPLIIGLIVSAVVGSVLFVLAERRAAEPIIPLHLFRDRNFNLATIGGLALAVAMFGSIAYLPTYLQMVHSVNATEAGLMLLPLMAGLMISAIGSGQLASRSGRYKWMPITGAVIMAIALTLLSTLQTTTSIVVLGVFIFVLGFGIGLGMQILVLIVQNAFPREVGTATAANNFFREIGASIGTAIVGALFTNRLTELLSERLPAGAADAGVSENSLTPSVVAKLPDAISGPIIASYNDSLTPVFLYLAPVLLAAAIVLAFVKERPLDTSIGEGVGH
ncbi:MDR family MFS transporter [Frigoribacterium sp. 2-23]|uniref:MDR family MFS transporter n=1 Tax=Frigoribacterium sp. 2-23 TaxID=3415006 RepID=UPI003C702F85